MSCARAPARRYIPIQFVCSIIIFITSLTGDYHDGHFAADDAYIYTAFVINCSQIAALYGLLLFYHSLREELQGTNPFYKFLCIKGVVFFTFWQSVFLSMLVAVDVITPTITYNTDQEVSAAAVSAFLLLPPLPTSLRLLALTQARCALCAIACAVRVPQSYGVDDFIVCIEMFFFAIAHWYAFPPREFESYRPADDVLALSHAQGEETEITRDAQDDWTYALAAKEGVLGKQKTVGEAANSDSAAVTPTTALHAYKRTEDVEMATLRSSVSDGSPAPARISEPTPTVSTVPTDAVVEVAPVEPPPVEPTPPLPVTAARGGEEMEVTDV